MGLLDFFRTKPDPASPTAPPRRRFATDRAQMFDLVNTLQLDALFRVAAGDRDDTWVRAFYDAAWTASISVPDPAHFDGPDGFPYYRLNLPRPGEAFEAQSLGNLAQGCVERNAGAAFFAGPDAPITAPEFVLSMGLLDGLLRHDSPDGDPIDRGEAGAGHDPATFDVEAIGARQQALTVKTEHSVLIGTPSAEFLPPYTARALHRYMTRIWKLDDPRVRVLVDADMRPSRNLVIGRKASSFGSEQEVAGEIERLFWFLPRNRAVILMPEHWSLDQMDRLADLYSPAVQKV